MFSLHPRPLLSGMSSFPLPKPLSGKLAGIYKFPDPHSSGMFVYKFLCPVLLLSIPPGMLATCTMSACHVWPPAKMTYCISLPLPKYFSMQVTNRVPYVRVHMTVTWYIFYWAKGNKKTTTSTKNKWRHIVFCYTVSRNGLTSVIKLVWRGKKKRFTSLAWSAGCSLPISLLSGWRINYLPVAERDGATTIYRQWLISDM